MDSLRDRSKRPRTSPNATRADVVEKIIHLRKNYHFSPEKIAMYLQRYHDVTISKSGVWRILHRLDMGRLPSSQRYKRHDRRWTRYEKQRPGHHVQIDVKFVEPLPAKAAANPAKAADMPASRRGKFYQFTAIDEVNIFNAKLKEWQDYYNYHRPHGGLSGQTPYERLRQKTQTEAHA